MLAAWPWNRWLALLAVTTIGGSQVLFEVILGNPEHFPRGAGFHLWTLFWALALPFLLLVAAETILVRRWGQERVFRAWRAALYALLAASFLRQIQAHHGEALDRYLRLELQFPLLLLLAAGGGWAAWHSRTKVHQFVGVLGVLGCLLAGIYIARSGLLGPAWRTSTSAAGSPAKGTGSPVWILLCDEWSYAAVAPDGRLDEAAFPALAALAKDGLWFREATSNHQWTHESVPTMLTGKRRPPEGVATLFQRLPETRTAMIIDPWLPTTQWIARYGGDKSRLYFRGRADLLESRPLDIARFLAHTLAESSFVRLPSGAVLRQGISLYTTLDQEIEILMDSADPASSPGRITYWHCPLPHQPFLYEADGRKRDEALAFAIQGGATAKPDVDRLWSAYRDQIRYLDSILGAFVRRLKERGLYQEAILIVTSDHGLRTGGWMEPAGYPDVRSGLVPRVPLLIKAPGLKPGISDVEVQHVDFAPTVLDLLGIPFGPGEFEGRSVLSGSPAARTKSFSDQGKWYEKAEGTDLWRKAAK